MKPPKIAPELLELAERSRSEPEVSCAYPNPDAGYQQLWKHFRHEAATLPLLFAGRPGGYPKISADPAHRTITLRWPDLRTDVEITTAVKRKAKLPKWLEARWEDFKTMKVTAARLAIDDPKEYLGGWQDLDTLDIACRRMVELIEKGEGDPTLELYIRSADRKYVIPVFLGDEPIERLDPIEILRRQIAEIPVDDLEREAERLKLIERREKLMLERDIRLQNVSPLD